MNEEIIIFLRTLMFLNSATLWIAGVRERYQPAVVASLVLLIGAVAWGAWPGMVVAAYWTVATLTCGWLLRCGLRDYQRGRIR